MCVGVPGVEIINSSILDVMVVIKVNGIVMPNCGIYAVDFFVLEEIFSKNV